MAIRHNINYDCPLLGLAELVSYRTQEADSKGPASFYIYIRYILFIWIDCVYCVVFTLVVEPRHVDAG